MSCPGEPVQQRYLRLAEAIEDRFDVAGWRSGDVDLWPAARMDLYLDMFRARAADTAPPPPPIIRRVAGDLATPLTNLWKARGDLEHRLARPQPADAVLLGDGVSLDLIHGAWCDRHGEPVIEALERQGRRSFLMQPGALDRLPWRRATYPANVIAVRGAIRAALDRSRVPELPDHAAILELLAADGVQAPSLGVARMAKRARTIAATALALQKVLRIVRPQLAFVVTWYAGLGHAFALACRREGVLCVDLQHCPQEGTHRAYRWRLPAEGFSTLPAMFWTWSLEDAAHISAWAGQTAEPWHAAIHGGHSQLRPFLDDQSPAARDWDARFGALGGSQSFEREILVALQPIGGRRDIWAGLAAAIERAPSGWRWWIRRHPSSTLSQDAEYAGLLELKGANVMIDAAAELPLPALLRRMSAVVSLASGAAAEAAAFGVPALFLDGEARGVFSGLIERGQAEMVQPPALIDRIRGLPARSARPAWTAPPPIDQTLESLFGMAEHYRRLCRSRPLARRGGG